MKQLIIILLILILLGIIIYQSGKQIKGQYPDTFLIEQNRDVIYESDRTLLYGSLFLDKLNSQIKELTDPDIKYDSKRIDIIKYSDMLL